MSGIPQVSQQAFIEKLQTGDEAWVKTLRSMAPDADGNGFPGDSEADIRALAEQVDQDTYYKVEASKQIDADEVEAFVLEALDLPRPGHYPAVGLRPDGRDYNFSGATVEDQAIGVGVTAGFSLWASQQD